MKLELVVDRQGVPLAAFTEAANVAEVHLAPLVLVDIPESIQSGSETVVLADKAYDSDPLRDELKESDHHLIAPHRKNRVQASRNSESDLKQYRGRYVVERTFSWLQSFRRVATRYEYRVSLYDGFVALACAFITLNKL